MEAGLSGRTRRCLDKGPVRVQVLRFPDGQICIEDNGRVVGSGHFHGRQVTAAGARITATGIYVGNGYLTTHDPKGDVLYGVDVFRAPGLPRSAPGPTSV